MSRCIENLLRPHVLYSNLDEGFRAMAADQDRETLAEEWSVGLMGDLSDDAR